MGNAKISQDLWPVKNEKMRNFRDRIWFIKYWAEYIKNTPDKKWGRGHANLINSQMRSSKEFYKDLKDKKDQKCRTGYLKPHKDEEWGEQQNMLIDSQISG